MTIVKEGEKEFIYSAVLKRRRLVKLDLDGSVIMNLSDRNTKVKGGFRDITGVAAAPDDSIFANMGYGSYIIHKFDKEGKLIKTFGGKGVEGDKFERPHTLSLDTRYGEPRLLVCERENRRLAHSDLEGKFISDYATSLRRPCAVSFHGDFCAVAELESRVAILDKKGTPVAFLGDNHDKKYWARFGIKPEQQKLGVFS